MKIAPVAEVKARFSEFLRKSQRSPVIVTKNGRPIAAIISVPQEEGELERLILANTPKFVELLNAARKDIQETDGLRHEDVWRRIEKKPARKPAAQYRHRGRIGKKK
jgi:prevent-host-death family protein